MPTLNLAYIAELVVRYLRKGAYLLLLSSFFVAIVGMWTSFATAFLYIYNVINELFVFVSLGGSSSGSSLVEKMFGILNCIGFLNAYENAKPVFISSLLFLFGRILFNVTLKSYRYFLDSIKPLIN